MEILVITILVMYNVIIFYKNSFIRYNNEYN